jgi:hypothetical protein
MVPGNLDRESWWRVVVGIVTTATLSVFTGEIIAIPPEKSDQQLLEDSDLVATVRVLAVTCTNQVYHPATDEILSSYEALLQILDVNKGTRKPFDVVLVYWQDVPTGLLGDWDVGYSPGEEVQTHLVWHADRQSYHTTWWNGKKSPSRVAHVESPKTRGAVTLTGGVVIPPAVPPYKLGVMTIPSQPRDGDSVGQRTGIRITRITPGSPADRRGLKVGDVIHQANDIRTTNQRALVRAIEGSHGRLRLIFESAHPPYTRNTVVLVLVDVPRPVGHPVPVESPPGAP